MPTYRNVMEEIVLNNIDNVVRECDCCACEECRSDIITYTLNRLPPKYVTTTKGELLTSIDARVAQNAIDIIVIMTQSAKYIKEHPKHEKIK